METNAYTRLTQAAWEALSSAEMTPQAAAGYVLNKNMPRSLPGILEKHMGKESAALIVDKLTAYTPGSNRDSVARKVRNWLGGQSTPDREDLFRICFALGLSFADAERVMALSTENAIHMRNPREVVYAYCLRKGIDYLGAQSLMGALPAHPPSEPGGKERERKSDTLTHLIRSELDEVTDEGEFIRFYIKNAEHFSALHNTAYAKFLRMFQLLSDPGATAMYAPESDAYSIERVVDEYLRMDVPLDKKTQNMDQVRKIIKRFWPNATAVKGMIARSEDVTRKTLLLLYIMAGGETAQQEYSDIDDEEATPDELLEEHCWRINLMLDSCGMSHLDPRSPFDWLVLYSLRCGEDEYMSERMEDILQTLFDTNNPDDD